MYRLYLFTDGRRSISGLCYTETFDTLENARERVRQLHAEDDYIIAQTTIKVNLPLVVQKR